MEDDDSSDEFVDASESRILEEVSLGVERPITGPIFPDIVDDEKTASIWFAHSFWERYGSGPNFFEGSLESAWREACLKPAKERKLLGIYLHDDNSVLTNVFCSQILCNENICTLIRANFIVFGWDVTIPENRLALMGNITKALGSRVTNTISSTPLEKFPMLIVVTRIKASLELVNVLTADKGIDELLAQLVETIDLFRNLLGPELEDEEQRQIRNQIKSDQDKAYEESLKMDRAKDEERIRQVQEKKEEEARMAAKIEERAKEQSWAAETLPPEPSHGEGDSTLRLRIRAPSGEFFERVFLTTDTLQSLFRFLLSKGYHVDDYQVILSYPTMELTALNLLTTFRDLNFHAQETLLLHKRPSSDEEALHV